MRIFSKFRDYYDCIVGSTGFDDTLIYNRESSTFPFKTKNNVNLFPYTIYRQDRSTELNIHPSILLVCGKQYPYTSFTHWSGSTRHVIHSFSYSDFLDDLVKCGYKSTARSIEKYDKERGFWVYRANYAELFTGYYTSKEIEELHISYNSPILTVGYNAIGRELQIQTNSVLSDVGFEKIIDPYTMFQEIEMYLGGVLCNVEDGKVSISDKDLAEQHGYNKHSFRKLPTPKGKKKRPKTI